MKLIVGLGNPGKEYEKTRHNSGYMALSKLAEEVGAEKPARKFNALCSMVNIDGEKVILMEPLTYMNLASWTPVMTLVAPGPEVTITTPGSPFTRA